MSSFLLAEHINTLHVPALGPTLFLGGWRAPWPLSAVGDGVLNTGYWPVLWFGAKLWFFLFLFVWARGTLLRLRYDQFMRFGWKVLIPAALVWIVAVALVQALRFTDISRSTMFGVLGGLALIGVIVSFLIPEKKREPEPAAEPEPFDAFAGGYPVLRRPAPSGPAPASSSAGPGRARARPGPAGGASTTGSPRAAAVTVPGGAVTTEDGPAEGEEPRG